MRVRLLRRYLMACLLIGTGLAAVADAQFGYSYYMGGLGVQPYPDLYRFYNGFGTYQYYNGFYSYQPNVRYFFNYTPRPLMGNYLPSRPLPPLSPFRIPYAGLVPQPYPYSYQPPLYVPPSYAWPYYYPARPYYYQHRFTSPRSIRRPSQRYGAATGQDGTSRR